MTSHHLCLCVFLLLVLVRVSRNIELISQVTYGVGLARSRESLHIAGKSRTRPRLTSNSGRLPLVDDLSAVARLVLVEDSQHLSMQTVHTEASWTLIAARFS